MELITIDRAGLAYRVGQQGLATPSGMLSGAAGIGPNGLFISDNNKKFDDVNFASLAALYAARQNAGTFIPLSPFVFDWKPADVDFGVWTNASFAFLDTSVNVVLQQTVPDPLLWITVKPALATSVTSRTGVSSFNNVAFAMGQGSNGEVFDFRMQFDVDFDTLLVSNGKLGFITEPMGMMTNPEKWSIDFNGSVAGTALNLNVQPTSTVEYFVGATPTTQTAGGNINAVFAQNLNDVAGGFRFTDMTDPSRWAVGIYGITETENRLTGGDIASLTHYGLGVVADEPALGFALPFFEVGRLVLGGLASDGSGLSPIFVDKNLSPSDAAFGATGVDLVIRQGMALSDNTSFQIYDSPYITSGSFSWGRWYGGAISLQHNASDSMDILSINKPMYWFTAQPSISLPSGVARFEHVVFLAGEGAQGPLQVGGPAKGMLGFTIDFDSFNIFDGSVMLHNGPSADPMMQQHWEFQNLNGSLEGPMIQFDDAMGTTCYGNCVTTSPAEGELSGFLFDGEEILGGTFKFWETADPNEWVTGVFGLGFEQRLTAGEFALLDRPFFGVFHLHNDGRVGGTPLFTGMSQQGMLGGFIMHDHLAQNYGSVLRLPGSFDLFHKTINVGGNAVDWGAWGQTDVFLDFNNSAIPTATLTDTYNWITFLATDPNVVSSKTGKLSYNLPLVFEGLEQSNQLYLERGYFEMDFDTHMLTGALEFTGVGEWDVNFSGEIKDNHIAITSASGLYQDTVPVSAVIDGQFTGGSAQGFAGAFMVWDPVDNLRFSTGTFLFHHDDRLSAAEYNSMDRLGLVSVDDQSGRGVFTYAGHASLPNMGHLVFRDFAQSNNFLVLRNADGTPDFFQANVGGEQVDWGYWNDTPKAADVYNDYENAAVSAAVTDPVSWVVGDPTDVSTIQSRSGVASYNNLVGFAGFENGVQLNTPGAGDVSMTVDFDTQTFSANLQYSTAGSNWNMNYSGAVSGNTMSSAGSGTYNGATPANGSLDSSFVGSNGQGIMGAFKNEVTGSPSIHSSGVFVIQE